MSDWWLACMPPLVPTMPTRLPAARSASSRVRSSATVRMSSTSLVPHVLEVELGKGLVAERAPIDGELGAGDVLRLIRREVHHAGGDVGGLAEARHHDVL